MTDNGQNKDDVAGGSSKEAEFNLGAFVGFMIRSFIFLAVLYQSWPNLVMALSHREAEAVVVSLRCGQPNLTQYDFEVDDVTYHGWAQDKKVCAAFPLHSKLNVYYVADDPTQNMPTAYGEPGDALAGRILLNLIFFAFLFPSLWRGFIKLLKYE